VVAAILLGWLLKRTKVGYEMRAVGFNRDAAHFAGINVEKNIVLCMLVSGLLCGLAGALTITGVSPHGISTLAAFENNGFNGLSVAFIAGCSPVGCIPAALLFAGLIYGGQTVQQVMGAPSEIINIMIGTIVFFMALGGIVPMLVDHVERKRAEKAERAAAAAAASSGAAAAGAGAVPEPPGAGAGPDGADAPVPEAGAPSMGSDDHGKEGGSNA
jgi:simple sugar transport system permease protein